MRFALIIVLLLVMPPRLIDRSDTEGCRLFSRDFGQPHIGLLVYDLVARIVICRP